MRQLEIRKKLRFVNGLQAVYRLELYDDRVLDKQIDAQTLIKNQAFVFDPDRMLSVKLQPTEGKFMAEAGLVNGFEQTRPQRPVDFQSGIDDLTDYRIQHRADRGWRRLCVQGRGLSFSHVSLGVLGALGGSPVASAQPR